MQRRLNQGIEMARFASLLLLVLFTLPGGALATNLTPSQVLANTQALQGQEISVIGVVTSLKSGIGDQGKAYQSFKLCDANACIQAHTLGTKTYTEGEQLTAVGHFWAVKHVGFHVYYNEFDLD